jgi:catechol 2,3-dioxygenase-like lactoylglutathione lyase family enzyme
MSSPQQKNGQPAFLRIVPRFIVNDLQLALTFYEKLGFRTTYNEGGFAIIGRDGVDLHMNHYPDDQPSHSVWWIEVTNIEGLYQQCLQHLPARDVCSKVEAKPWGFKEFHIRDPFRNLILFDERIPET